MRISHYILPLVGLVLLASCRKDKPERPVEQPTVVGTQGGVYITNEGNFGWGNAKVSFYDIASGNVVEDLFEPVNGVALGDVCQSMRVFNNKAYVVVNNSNKVEVVDPSTFVITATITGFNSPRYFLPVSNSKAYVTDLYANSIAVVDLNSNTITGSIPCRGWTEELVLAVRQVNGGRRYLAPAVAQQLALATLDGNGSPFDVLSSRELEVAMMLVRGRASDSLPADFRELAAISDLIKYGPRQSSQMLEDTRRLMRRAFHVVDELFWQ